MNDQSPVMTNGAAPGTGGREIPLSQARLGQRGVIARVHARPDVTHHGLAADELERRLLELGFVEGAAVEVIHEGLIGGDPMAVRLDDMRVALRRRDAAEVTIRLDEATR
ncbi:FeoA family protein [Phenylobacterium sp.]|uniref:FeoA family protein n=1 Tax=Phenylobacterium sp. TaxID=1871053 RepID=UPI00198EB63B|nr:FeoA family protein [Phenylobacterium sp.]MBC7167573.1 ferrous iron transport protein A [Phenylobacterium sp.]